MKYIDKYLWNTLDFEPGAGPFFMVILKCAKNFFAQMLTDINCQAFVDKFSGNRR